ncbi:MAG TPA: HEAT repeat domain-containing protein, partial [Polyangiaceae bacterium]|nr:HEAT repeat domain-containing protein [Polyangiaceae bacterium]
GTVAWEQARLAALSKRPLATADRRKAWLDLSKSKNLRVREAALEAMAQSPAPVASQVERRIAQLLASDRWTFVRVGAARALGAKPRAASGDQALMAAVTKDGETPTVRAAALTALGQRKSTSAGELVHDVAADAQEPLAVRIAAVDALGALCRRDSAALLYKLALRAGYPELPYDQQLGMAALAALGAIKPPDVALKLAPLLSRDMRVPRAVRMIARDVLIRPGTCR